MRTADLVIIGGGPAGMAAAVSAYDAGVRDILILERDAALGGILQQCIHNGFGLHRFGEELTGPEYAERYAAQVEERQIACCFNTMVLDITPDKRVTAMNAQQGVFTVQAGAVILAMGCRERSRGALNIPGSRPAGIYTAGTAQRFVNLKGLMPGKKAVILGSGDIGLIMARRMTLEGAEVKMVCELMPYSGGLNRNIVQCLEDFDIPLRLSHTVSRIHGADRVTGVTVSRVDENGRVIPGTGEYVACDTLLLSCGLIPENELSRQMGLPMDPVTGGAVVSERRETAVPGVFACGNVLHVHDLVDYVSEEAALAGRAAADYILGRMVRPGGSIPLKAGNGVRYTVPQWVTAEQTAAVRVYFRVGAVFFGARLVVRAGERVLLDRRKPKLAPGEMEWVELTPEMLRQADGGIEIAVEAATGGAENGGSPQKQA
ncbi:MAG: FAD-dependent oxidoreductase [Clostridiales bacterium]|nr:FAD-dependent oxidoreductase [Clostridiales bacterium]